MLLILLLLSPIGGGIAGFSIFKLCLLLLLFPSICGYFVFILFFIFLCMCVCCLVGVLRVCTCVSVCRLYVSNANTCSVYDTHTVVAHSQIINYFFLFFKIFLKTTKKLLIFSSLFFSFFMHRCFLL